jgi:hypothetical protein
MSDPGSSDGIAGVVMVIIRLVAFLVLPALAAIFVLVMYLVWPKNRRK